MATSAESSAHRSRAFGWLAAALFAAAAAAELTRVALGAPWPGFPAWASNAVGTVLATVWLVGTLMLLLRRRSPGLARAAWMFGIAGPILMVLHAMVTSAGGSRVGMLFLLAAVVAMCLLRGTFDPGEYGRLRARARGEPRPDVPEGAGGSA
jgi:hypothetical protein